MAEINLPTKATQDDINTKTTDIQKLLGTANPSLAGTETLFKYMKRLDSYFPVKSGTNFNEMSTLGVSTTFRANKGGEQTLLNISGKGILTRLSSDDYTIVYIITVDGVLLPTEFSAKTGQSISVLIPFKSSLAVKAYTVSSASTALSQINYLLG